MDTAEKYFKDVIRISSREHKIQYLDDSIYSLGLLYLFIGKSQTIQELIERYEHNIESYRPKILKAFYKAVTNDVDGALTGYRDVLPKTKGRDSVIVYSLMGDAYRRKGLSTEALNHYRQALSRDPGFSSAYYGMGLTYMNMRDVDHARECFSKAISSDPDNVLALSDMADILLIRRARPEEAFHYVERAVSKSPPFFQPYLTMGNVLVVMQKDTEAEGYYKKALERGVAAYMVPFSKARAYYLRGDAEKAQEQISELRKFKNLPDHIKNIIAKE
jgi:tetratricopeptide (TPR) repeat protein